MTGEFRSNDRELEMAGAVCVKHMACNLDATAIREIRMVSHAVEKVHLFTISFGIAHSLFGEMVCGAFPVENAV